MRPGYALYIHRFAPFSARSVHTVPESPTWFRQSVLVAAMFFAVVLAAQAQESVEEVALPPWSEPTLPSSEPAPSTQAAPLPSAPEPVTSAPEPLPSTPAEPLPSSSAPLPSSEQAFPSSSDPWSSSTNYTTAQTTVIPAPVATGPYGGSARRVFPAGETVYSGEPRRFHYASESDSARCVG